MYFTELRQEIAVWRRAAASLSSYSRDEDIVRRALEKKVLFTFHRHQAKKRPLLDMGVLQKSLNLAYGLPIAVRLDTLRKRTYSSNVKNVSCTPNNMRQGQ